MQFALSKPEMFLFFRRALIFTLPLICLAAGLLSWWTVASPQPTELPTTSAALEQRWGIQIRQVGVTADGGLVDLRYLVTDADKAARMFADLQTTPLIRTTDGTTIQLRTLIKHHHALEVGRTYYMLYRNNGNAVTPGAFVSVLVGDVQVSGIVAR
jgi:hypothetical protein